MTTNEAEDPYNGMGWDGGDRKSSATEGETTATSKGAEPIMSPPHALTSLSGLLGRAAGRRVRVNRHEGLGRLALYPRLLERAWAAGE